MCFSENRREAFKLEFLIFAQQEMDGGMIAWTKSSTNERQSLTWRALDFEGREKLGHTGCTVHKRTTSRCIVVSAHHKRWFTMDMNKRCYSFHLFKLRLTRRERKETV